MAGGAAPAPAEAGDALKARERRERTRPLTKIVCRRLPPTMTEESFMEQVSPIPEHDYFYFSKPDTSLAPNLFCRAYINFINEDDIYIFRDKFDDYIFLDDRGIEYPAIVEYAPFQRMPKNRRKKDLKCGTLETDQMYLNFLESLKETDSDSREPKMEYSYQPTEEKKETTTPLLEFLAARKRDERRRREERQRRRPRNRNAKDDENFDDDIKKIKPRENEDESMDVNEDDLVENVDSEIKETQFVGKGRPKSYKEQRRLVEEHRKKPDYLKKDKPAGKDNNDPEDDEKMSRKNKREQIFKDRNKEREKFADKRDKPRFGEKKFDKSESNYSKKPDTKSDQTANKVAEKALPISKTGIVSSKIKPFTQLPRLKMSDLSKAIDEMDNSNRQKPEIGKGLSTTSTKNKSPKIDNAENASAVKKDESKEIKENKNFSSKENDKSATNEADKSSDVDSEKKSTTKNTECDAKRRNSLESKEKTKSPDDSGLKRHKSLDEKSDASFHDRHREGDPRTERRIRNKDRPSLAIYQPGMGKFSKQRIDREKDGSKSGDSNKITSSNNSSSNSQE